jgi:hypothetical protein
VVVSRLAFPTCYLSEYHPSVFVKSDRHLSICSGDMHGVGMPNHAPLHFFEIVFYTTAVFLAVIGLAW